MNLGRAPSRNPHHPPAEQRSPLVDHRLFRLQYPKSARSTRVSRELMTAMLEQGDRRSAIRIMRRWTRAHPRDTAHRWMYVSLARALAADKKLEEAAAAFEEALKNNALRAPQDLLQYADLLLKLNKPERAEDLYRQVSEVRT